MSEKQDIFTMLGGQVRFWRGTYNPTSDAAWLAAFAADVPAKTVLDVGVGTGGAILCLMASASLLRILTLCPFSFISPEKFTP